MDASKKGRLIYQVSKLGLHDNGKMQMSMHYPDTGREDWYPATAVAIAGAMRVLVFGSNSGGSRVMAKRAIRRGIRG